MKKILSAVLAVLLVASICAVPALAEKATASTMSLEKAEGTVGVTNKSGKSITSRDGMKLYNGYGLETALKSYAYIGLDGTKAVKLDSVSKAAVVQSGKKLEVDLKSGELFFNVTAPLKTDESLNIRTSTMVTGIRGTAGWLEVISDNVARLYMLSGKATVISTDPVSGETRRTTVSAGEMATSYTGGESGTGADVEIVKARFNEEDVPGFVAQEIKKDTELQKQITEQTDLSVPKIIGEADNKLSNDELNKAEEQKNIDDKLDDLENKKSVDPLYEDPIDPAVGPGSVAPPVNSITLYGNITNAQLQAALDSYASVIIDTTATATIDTVVTINPGKTLTNNGVLILNGTLENFSVTSFYNSAGAIVSGTGVLQNGNALPGKAVLDGDVYCTVQQGFNSELTISGTFNGELYVSSGTATITGTVDGSVHISNGTVNLNGGLIRSAGVYDAVTLQGGSLNINNGSITATGADGAVRATGGTFTFNSGSITSENEPAVYVGGTGTFTFNGGVIESAGSFGVEVAAGTATYYGGIILAATPVSGTLANYDDNDTSPESIEISVNDGGFYTFYHDNLGELVAEMIANAGTNKIAFDIDSASQSVYIPADMTIASGQHVEFIGNNSTIRINNTFIINRGILTLSDGTVFLYNGSGGVKNYGTLSLGGDTPSQRSLDITADIINYSTGIINIRDSVSVTDLTEAYNNAKLTNDGIINIYDNGALNLNGNVAFTNRGTGTAVYSGGALNLLEESLLTLDGGGLLVKAGGTATVMTSDNYGVVANSSKITVESGGSLKLIGGMLVNNISGAETSVTASVSDVEISDWPDFTMINDSFGKAPNSLYSWRYSVKDDDNGPYYRYCAGMDIYEAIDDMNAFIADSPDTIEAPVLFIAPQSDPIALPETVDFGNAMRECVTLNLGGNTLRFTGKIGIKGYEIAVTNGAVELTTAEAGSVCGVVGNYVYIRDATLTVISSNPAGIPSGAIAESEDNASLSVINSAVSVSSSSGGTTYENAALVLSAVNGGYLNLYDNTNITASGNVNAISFLASGSFGDESVITLRLSDGCGIFADGLPLLVLPAPADASGTLKISFYTGSIFGSKAQPASVGELFGNEFLNTIRSDNADLTGYIESNPDMQTSGGYHTVYIDESLIDDWKNGQPEG